MADGTGASGLSALTQAASGKLSFFKQGVIMPVVVGSAAGGVGVVLGRYFTRKMFVKKNADGSYQMENGRYVDEDSNSKLKRGGVKIALGLVGASVVRKYSPPAALGLALGLGVDGVADMIETKGFEYLDKWFTTRPAAGVYGGAVNGGYGGGRTYSREVQ